MLLHTGKNSELVINLMITHDWFMQSRIHYDAVALSDQQGIFKYRNILHFHGSQG